MAARPLKVSVQSLETIQPQLAQKQRHFFLSNFDQVLAFTVYTINVFQCSAHYPFPKAVEAVKTALAEVLLSYPFLAGRLTMNDDEGRLEIDCNGNGVPFSVARANLALQDVGQITYPNDDFECLVRNCDENILLSLQMTEFLCGGFVLGMATSHAAFDGISASRFLDNLASVAAGHGIKTPPFIDRTLLKARSPPRVEGVHPELVPPEASARAFYAHEENVEFSGFVLRGDAVAALRRAVEAEDYGGKRCSAFVAVTAHLWRARTAAMQMAAHETSSVMFAVDIRRRMDPPLPAEFAGNAVFPGYACARAGEVTAEDGYIKCVKLVIEGIRRVSRDSYVRSCIDWGGNSQGGGPRSETGSVFVSSWWGLKLGEIRYPWGIPIYAGPAFHKIANIALLLPQAGEPSGVLVYIGLPSASMSIFTSLFFDTPQ